MKISGIKKIKPELIIKLFDDFKKELKSNSLDTFSYEDFVFFVNTHNNQEKYLIVAYKFHRDEAQLEYENFGCLALNVYDLFSAFSGSNNKSVIDDNGQKIILINKVGKNKFELINK